MGAFAAVKELGTRFHQDVCLAVLAAVAYGVLQAPEAGVGASPGSSPAARARKVSSLPPASPAARVVSSLPPASPAARVVSSLPPASVLADWSEEAAKESDIPVAYIWTLPGFPGCVGTPKLSPVFEACGRRWQLHFGPAPDHPGYFQLYLSISPSVKQSAAFKADFRLELFGRVGEVLTHEFTAASKSYGYPKFNKLSGAGMSDLYVLFVMHLQLP